jgi:hypothetical protein
MIVIFAALSYTYAWENQLTFFIMTKMSGNQRSVAVVKMNLACFNEKVNWSF